MSQKVYSAMKIEFFPNQKRSGKADLTHSSLVKWVNISEPSCLARFFRCLVFR